MIALRHVLTSSRRCARCACAHVRAAQTLMYTDADWIDFKFREYVTCYAMFHGGVAMILAGIWAMLQQNTFDATVFTTYGEFHHSLPVPLSARRRCECAHHR
jgi:succinate-acetate transporter protein